LHGVGFVAVAFLAIALTLVLASRPRARP